MSETKHGASQFKLNVYMKNVFHSCTTYNSLWVDRMNASRWFSCSGGFTSIAVLFISFYFCVVFYFCSFQPCIMGFKSIHRSAHTFVLCDAKRELCKYNPKWCTNCPRTRSTYTMHNIRGFNGKNETIFPTHHSVQVVYRKCETKKPHQNHSWLVSAWVKKRFTRGGITEQLFY